MITNTVELREKTSKKEQRWAKKVTKLPNPAAITRADDLGGRYIYDDEVEIGQGEYLIEGYRRDRFNSRSKWEITIWAYDEDEAVELDVDDAKAELKQLCKDGLIADECCRELLDGSGQLASAVRAAHLHQINNSICDTLIIGEKNG